MMAVPVQNIYFNPCDLQMEERRDHLTPSPTWVPVSTSVCALDELAIVPMASFKEVSFPCSMCSLLELSSALGLLIEGRGGTGTQSPWPASGKSHT